MSTTHDLATTAATGIAKATGVSKEFAQFWATLFAENAAAHPIGQGETDDQWLTRLAGETSAEVQAICEAHLTDRAVFRRLAGALAMFAKSEFGHRPARKQWDEVSPSAKEILEMKQARKGDDQ